MEKINNIFTVDSVIEEDSYIKVTGKYLIPEDLPFTEERPWSYLDTPNKVIALVI